MSLLLPFGAIHTVACTWPAEELFQECPNYGMLELNLVPQDWEQLNYYFTTMVMVLRWNLNQNDYFQHHFDNLNLTKTNWIESLQFQRSNISWSRGSHYIARCFLFRYYVHAHTIKRGRIFEVVGNRLWYF